MTESYTTLIAKWLLLLSCLKPCSHEHRKFVYVDCYLLSSDPHFQWKPILAKLLWISFLSPKESHKKYTQTASDHWYLRLRTIHSVLKLQQKKCWSKKDQVLYLLKNDPVEFVVTIFFDKLFHKPLKPLTKQPVPTDAHSLLCFSPSFMTGSNYQFINPVNASHSGFTALWSETVLEEKGIHNCTFLPANFCTHLYIKHRNSLSTFVFHSRNYKVSNSWELIRWALDNEDWVI